LGWQLFDAGGRRLGTKHFTTLNPGEDSHFSVKYLIANHGRTPAIIKNVTACLVIVDGIPKNRRIFATAEVPSAIAIVKGVPDGPLMCISAEPAREARCDEILSGKAFLDRLLIEIFSLMITALVSVGVTTQSQTYGIQQAVTNTTST
jgi:hypothetical protein